MAKAEEFDQAQRLEFKENDFSLVDEIYHPDYSAPDPTTGIIVNLEDDKIIVSTLNQQNTIGYFRLLFENDNFVCLHRFFRSAREEIYWSTMTAINYKEGKVFRQETVSEPLDYDPSEGQDWNWEDYE